MPPQTQQQKPAVAATTFALMVAVALLFDAVQVGADLMHAIPLVGNASAVIFTVLLDIWAYLTFWFWFKIHGVSFMNPKRAMALNGGLLIELIPIVNALPAWTLAVVIIFVTTKAEEEIAKTLGRVGGVMKVAGKMANVASKFAPNPALRQGLRKVSEGADRVSSVAQEKAGRVRSLGQGGQLGSSNGIARAGNATEREGAERPSEADSHAMPMESAYKTGTGNIAGETPPKPRLKQNTGDIGAQPIFRQPPPSEKAA